MKQTLRIFTLAGCAVAGGFISASAADPVANFSAEQCKVAVFSTGFDTAKELDAWTAKGSYGGWTLNSQPYGYGAPAFTAINPASKASLYFPRVQAQRNEALISPEVEVQPNDRLSFWLCTCPIWLFYAHTDLYVVDGSSETLLFNNFLWSQENPSDDTQWIKYEYPLDDYAGKTVKFKWVYTGNDGDPVMIDDMAVSRPDQSASAKVVIAPGATVEFVNLSEGEDLVYNWTLPGASTPASRAKNPKVVYAEPGVYDVTLEVKDAAGRSASVTRQGFVTVQAAPLEAAIGAPTGAYFSPEAGIVVPLQTPLTFKDMTQGNVESREWIFPGTDTPTASAAEVTVEYVRTGMFDVDLKVTNSTGSSSTYIYGVRAGMPSLVWNIPASENSDLAPISLGWYGYYGGTNWLDMPAFGEFFHAPLTSANISSVNVYFGACKVSTESKNHPLTVSICKNENGLPGEVLASASMPCSELVDASQLLNAPTVFTFAEPVTVEEDFFVTIGDFPNNEGDDIAMYCSPRREDLNNSTVYHLLLDLDDRYQPTGTSTWVKNTDEALSFAIAPNITFVNEDASIVVPEAAPSNSAQIDFTQPVEYYTISGRRLPSAPTAPGLYILRQSSTTLKLHLP